MKTSILMMTSCLLLSCGVKLPPLAPLAETPQSADQQEKVQEKTTESEKNQTSKKKKQVSISQ